MKAMILAAGLGTRLRPLTNDRPKALVELASHTMLEVALARMRSIGIHDVIVNAHHCADMIVDYLKVNRNFGMNIQVSHEQDLLDTGGGLKLAASFLRDSSSSEPFVLHNVDIVSTIDLRRMVRYHIEHCALATLAVQNRKSSRKLLFDEQGQLCGRQTARSEHTNEPLVELVRPTDTLQSLAFAGIHVLSPRIFELLDEQSAFSIINTYVRLAAQRETIVAFRADDAYWRDLGRPESITQATQDLAEEKFSIQ